MEQRLDQLENGQIVHELKKYFTSEELDEAREEIDGFIEEVYTVQELAEKIRGYLDNEKKVILLNAMSLYQEIPKESIMTILQERFTREELDAVRLEIHDILLSSNSMMDAESKVFEAIRNKHAAADYKRIHQDNFMSN